MLNTVAERTRSNVTSRARRKVSRRYIEARRDENSVRGVRPRRPPCGRAVVLWRVAILTRGPAEKKPYLMIALA